MSDATFIVNDPGGLSQASRPLAASDYGTPWMCCSDWLEVQPISASIP